MFNTILELTKYRLSLSVIFSSIAGYLIAMDYFLIETFLLLLFGGFFLVGASNGFNQIIEKERDSIMDRTKNRPIPLGKISPRSAFIICLTMILSGIVLLYFINLRTAFFGLLSALIYLFIYTPLKTRTPLCVFFGAIPGAIPFMLGWVAATNKFGIEPGVLFMIQFFWQFPHFWAIGWLSDDDYKKAGFKMLPTGKKDKSTAFQIVFYTIWTILVSLIPLSGFSGLLTISYISGLLIFLAGLFMLSKSINLMLYMNNLNALRLKYASIFYLTFIQIIFVLDKFII
ncbi:MAG: protoheme IX farnesyltransferase [Flavobacteriales bacterium]|jgi:protoheme IX farnesyltransferase|nr:MAG: protoheme IX farnesyltransferase [Flavobacteriales bacterium]|tara:strand:+ start:2403 stop:3260 length:858 start_codon:yes stop_codon:yes gene_type:complete